MARRKYKRRLPKDMEPNFQRDALSKISPETKKAILVFLLLILGFISLLSLFHLSGKAGELMLTGMKYILGWLYFFVPLILIFFGYILLNPKKYVIHFRHYLGLLLFFLSISGFLNLVISSKDVYEQIAEGHGGGYFGIPFYLAFSKLAGFWGAFVILLGLLIISIFLTFNLNLSHLRFAEKIRQFLNPRRDRIDEDKIDETSLSGLDSEHEEKSSVEDDLQKGYDIKIDGNIDEPKKKLREIFPAIPKKIYKDIKIPLDLLSDQKGVPVSQDIEVSKDRIKKTFANFNMNVEMSEVHVGPTFTQFTLKPDENIKLSRILALHDNLALSLAAHPLRIEAPIPGKSLVGIEVPNKVVSTVRIKEILSDSCFKKSEGHLVFALGKDVSGNNHVVDLAKMPHLLIAGATGSGKSVCVNSLIMSLLYRLNPNEIKFLMIDMKRLELPQYNGIPHLLTPVITKIDKIKSALSWCINEMEKRLDLLSKVNAVDIFEYNLKVSIENRLPQIIIIIDELAELMQLARQDVEVAISRLATMGRAPGLHLVLATQRPSVDVITGTIKVNIPARIAFAVASQIDSRTILDTSGAEKLLGRGDMLFICAEMPKPKRMQGAFVSSGDKERIIEFLKSQAEPDYLEEVTEFGSHTAGFASSGGGDADALLEEAKKIVVKGDKASATLLQRRLRVGYARAARILDQLEEIGIVGPAQGAKPRDVLMTEEDLVNDNIYGSAGILPYSKQDDKSYNDEEDEYNEELEEDEELEKEIEEEKEKLEENIYEEEDEFEIDEDKKDELI